jgi:hypothetical protein
VGTDNSLSMSQNIQSENFVTGLLDQELFCTNVTPESSDRTNIADGMCDNREVIANYEEQGTGSFSASSWLPSTSFPLQSSDMEHTGQDPYPPTPNRSQPTPILDTDRVASANMEAECRSVSTSNASPCSYFSQSELHNASRQLTPTVGTSVITEVECVGSIKRMYQ